MEALIPAYMSGALSGLPEEVRKKQEARYELIQSICKSEGFDLYCPHQHSSPERHADKTPREVYQLDSRVREVEFVIADCSLPALGVGIECEMAEQRGIPVLLIAEQGSTVSRLIRGLPNVFKAGLDADVLFFPTEEALARRIRQELRELRPRIVEASRRRGELATSLAALAEYARTRKVTYDRYERLYATTAAVGGRLPLTPEEWEELDREMD